MNILKSAGAVLILFVLSNCASIMSGTSQSIDVATNPPEAKCTLYRNDQVAAVVDPTPASVDIRKTKHDINVVCEKEGYEDGKVVLRSGIEGWTWGNIIFGGLIGWAIDSAAGADNRYRGDTTVALVPTKVSGTKGAKPATAVAAPSLRSKWRTLSNRTHAIPKTPYGGRAFYMRSGVPLTLVRQGKVLDLYEYRLPDGSPREVWVRKEHVRPE